MITEQPRAAAPGQPHDARHDVQRDALPAAAEPSLLAAIAAGVAGGADLDALLRRFLEPVMRLAGAQAGAVRVLSDDGRTLQLVSTLNLPAEFFAAELAVDRDCGHCGSAVNGEPVVWAAELEACALRSGAGYFGAGCRRLLAVPLRHRGRVLGVYNLFFDGGDAPPAAVQGMLKSVGELLGLALNNARLEAEQMRATLAQQRQAMAAEVHDSLAQSLAFVKMRLALLQDALDADDATRARQYCQEVRSVASQAHASLRGILTDLRAPMDPQGLVHALRASVERFRGLGGSTIEFVNELPALSLKPEREAEVFHVVQEALNNIVRHAGARHAWLRIGPAAHGGVHIVIDDDGIGPAGAGSAGATHYGLEIMRERARRLGGRLDVQPRDGGGTRVQLVFPAAAATELH